MSQTYSLDQVKDHSKEGDLWIVVEKDVYDLSKFADEHPGGKKILLRVGGQDATEQFWKFHNDSILKKVGGPLKIGSLEGAQQESSEDAAEDEDTSYYGDLVPWGDPNWYQDWASPYYKDSHKRLRTAIRKYTDEYLTPNATEWDEAKEIPASAFKHAADFGILAAIASGGDGWASEYAKGLPIPGDVPADEWDSFHNFILVDEMSRCGSGGILYGFLGGFGIGLPPVKHFGSDELKQRVLPDCIAGRKRICLAITEPSGGSDVANITTTATKSADGKHYIVNGEKKWITGGIYSDYFVTAVRTGGKGMNGISLMVIPRSEGVKTSHMKCTGVWASGTSYVAFEDAKVPVENLLGEENKGFLLIMSNFNPERIGIAIQANRFARVCLEESLKYASKRKTFGVLLRDHPVIRNKLARMACKVEATHSWLENVIYQSTVYPADELTTRGGGTVALLKAQATETLEYCANEAAQIFGGLAYSRGSQGEKVERLMRDYKAYSIPGGSVEIMQDLGVRQSIKIASIMGAKL